MEFPHKSVGDSIIRSIWVIGSVEEYLLESGMHDAFKDALTDQWRSMHALRL